MVQIVKKLLKLKIKLSLNLREGGGGNYKMRNSDLKVSCGMLARSGFL